MAAQMSVWSPDTCGCSIEHTDDLQFTFIASHASCPRHAQHHGTPQHYATVVAENRQKNLALNAIIDAVPTAACMWAVDQATGVITITASALPDAARLAAIKAQFPDVVFVRG